MSSRADLSSTTYIRSNSRAAAAATRTATNGAESASVAVGIVMPENRSDTPLARQFDNAAFGPIVDGHYTEF
jgi:hypothetical protein